MHLVEGLEHGIAARNSQGGTTGIASLEAVSELSSGTRAKLTLAARADPDARKQRGKTPRRQNYSRFPTSRTSYLWQPSYLTGLLSVNGFRDCPAGSQVPRSRPYETSYAEP
jgi:hypothetical protein